MPRGRPERSRLTVIGIVPEPVAAAMHYGVTGSADGTTFLVYDLGGGTFDISLIRMTEDSIEVLAVGGDHMLGGADWDKKLFDHILEQTIKQTGDDSIEDDEGALQELRSLAESTKQALSKTESKTIVHRQTGTAVKIIGDPQAVGGDDRRLLRGTIRITNRTLEEAEQRHPGIRGQIRELLLVGGSSWMPAVAERLRASSRGRRSSPIPTSRSLRAPRSTRPARRSATWNQARAAKSDPATRPSATASGARLASGPVTAEAVRASSALTGIDEERIEDFAKRTVVNVLPKAVGIKLLDTSKPNWQAETEAASYIEHLVAAQTQLPYQAEKFTASTAVHHQESIEVEIWEQSGAVPDPELSANHRVDDAGLIEGLGPFNLPEGSPVDITIGVDAEGTVSLVAVEPRSGKELKMSVKISIMSEEQVAEAKANVSGLVLST